MKEHSQTNNQSNWAVLNPWNFGMELQKNMFYLKIYICHLVLIFRIPFLSFYFGKAQMHGIILFSFCLITFILFSFLHFSCFLLMNIIYNLSLEGFFQKLTLILVSEMSLLFCAKNDRTCFDLHSVHNIQKYRFYNKKRLILGFACLIVPTSLKRQKKSRIKFRDSNHINQNIYAELYSFTIYDVFNANFLWNLRLFQIYSGTQKKWNCNKKWAWHNTFYPSTPFFYRKLLFFLRNLMPLYASLCHFMTT